MNRGSIPVVVAVLLAALLGPALYGAGQPQAPPESPPGAAVFEMKYRGLDAPDDPLAMRGLYGFGAPPGGESDSFVQAVKSKVKDCSLAYNGRFPKAQWAVVELQDKKPAALYFDINADGKLSDNEKFLPAPKSKLGYLSYVFITSDFQIRAPDGREVPFRVMLAAMGSGNGQYSYMWSPLCVLEGQATLAGVPMKLALCGQAPDGSYTTFGLGSLFLIPAQHKNGEPLSGTTLSSVIKHEGTFYRLRLADSHAPDSVLRVVLEKDTTPTGRAAVTVATRESAKTRLYGLQLVGAQDDTIQFFLSDPEPTLPAGRYNVGHAFLNYGRENTDEWRVDINSGPQLSIAAAQIAHLDLGQPVLSIRAIKESDRNQADAQALSTYAKGTPIFLAPQIKGKAGEAYGRFTQREAGTGRTNDIRPHILITASDGKQVASEDLAYG
jgi:hypothetical protein